MPVVSCLIVDDEPIARDIIATYCSHVPDLNVVCCCGNAFEAIQLLKQQKIDILFLDINMPVLDGISFLKTLQVIPQVIFTTAYKDFAVTAFDLAACDYLLKPISLDRFIVAVNKATQRLGESSGGHILAKGVSDTLFIKTGNTIYNILPSDLLYAEAKGNYTQIVCSTLTILPAMAFNTFERALQGDQFLRVHRSYIINKVKITKILGNVVYVGPKEIPIGNLYRDNFFKSIGV
jgi:DNA-binding LytR/AlgR family response regulator